MNKYIYAIIVCYHPTDNIYQLLNSLIQQDVYPIVIDNSEEKFLNFDKKGYLYRKLGKNVGIAEAQNIGIDLALEQGAKVIVFFDQDSVVSNDLISRLYKPILENKTDISAPIYKNIAGNFYYQIIKCNKWGLRTKIIPSPNMPNFTTNIAISSGSMIRCELFNIIGKMDHSLFIDHVDTEWFLRAFHKGYSTLIVTNAVMKHRIGDDVVDLKWFKVPIHSPLRRYYRIRNNFLLLRYNHFPKLLAFREIFFSFLHQFIIILFSPGKRWNYIKNLFKAVFDGIVNKKGKITQ
ncbi:MULTISPECIES: glycosyltransferase family 2 protein [Glaesserella]|uniref:Rhamnosyltransferase n=1 Tax=Glaesserella australis TaxID=2094024 RepID=A0A328BZ86_9PAST|nr:MULTISPECIES: glycosyltransferase family 2 protein [Glaesserella]AUI67107.1 rhamnosyl transferase [Glaesserella sp. 15-184]RAL18150.1 rhamnosyltransferase [Glaesserella australis]